MNSENPYVKELAKRPGQKEARYAHLLGEETEEDHHLQNELPHEPARKHVNEMEARIASLEQELAEIKETLAKITKELF